MDGAQEKRIEEAMEKAKLARGWAARDNKQTATLAIAFSLSAMTEILIAIHAELQELNDSQR